METRSTRQAPPARRFFRAVVGTACAVAATAATAQEPDFAEPAPRLLVEAAAWLLSAENNGVDFAFVDEGGGLSGGGRVHTVGQDRDTVPRLRVGWSPGFAQGLVLTGEAWDYDNRATAATGEIPLQVGALLATPDFSIGRSVVDSASAESRTDATTFDLGAAWNHSLNGRAMLSVGAGLRLFRYDRELAVVYRRNIGVQEEEFVNRSAESSGIGPRMLVQGRYRLGRRFTLGGEIGLAVPFGDREMTTDDTALIDGTFDSASRTTSLSSRAFLQIEGDFRLDARITGGWSVFAAYAFQHWAGVEQQIRFVDEFSDNTVVSEETDVAFGGLLFGFRYTSGDATP